MKKIITLIVALMFLSVAHGSKLGKFIHKLQEKQKAQQQREWQQDMNFSDFDFRLDRHYSDDSGQSCRDYVFRARSNPYRHGRYTVCEER
jgi:hypothetical protein